MRKILQFLILSAFLLSFFLTPPKKACAFAGICQFPTATVTCSASPTSITAGQSVTWSSVVSGGVTPFTYSWTGTDGLTGTGATANFTYNTGGIKTASVMVTDARGQTTGSTACSNSVSVAGVGGSPGPAMNAPILDCGISGTTPRINLSWSPIAGTSYYKIYRTGPGQPVSTYYDYSYTNSYTDFGVLNNSVYTYQVSAVDGALIETLKSASTGNITTYNCTPPSISITANSCGGALGHARNPVSIPMPASQYNNPYSDFPQNPAVTINVTATSPNITAVYLYRAGASNPIASAVGSTLTFTDTRGANGITDYTDYTYYAQSFSPTPPVGHQFTDPLLSNQVHPVHPDGSNHTLKCDTVEPVATIYQIERFATPDCFTPDAGNRPWSTVPQPILTQAVDTSSGVNNVSFGLSNVATTSGPISNPTISSFNGSFQAGFWRFLLADQQTVLPGSGGGLVAALNKEYNLYTRSCDNVPSPYQNCSDFNNSASASTAVDFYYLASCQGPWLQTIQGDVHSNTQIIIPGGPTN